MESMKLGAIALRALSQLAVDRLRDVAGSSLPVAPAQVQQPEVLTRLLREHGLDPGCGELQIHSIQRQPVPSVSTNCQNLVLSISSVPVGELPDSLFVKVPMENLSTRWFFAVIRSWELESHVSRHIAHALPIRTPRTLATACRGSRFFLVQENLNADQSVRLFTNPDMQEGPALDTVRRCLDTFARLHAWQWDADAARREGILPRRYHLFLSPRLGPVSKALNRFALKPCMHKRPGLIPPTLASAYELTLAHWDALLEYWFDGPLSLLHGDSHLGNFFASGEDMGMLDWQAAHWGKGMRDVNYFLVDSLPAPRLAEHEQELIAYYLRCRASYGAPLDAREAWQEYRSFSFHTLMTIVVSIGFGALNAEQDSLMTEILARAVAATERLDYAGWLGDFLSASDSAERVAG